MKRYFVLLIALFLLTGCSSKVETVPETTMQQETQPDPGWYIPNSEVERSTGGAVRAFDLPGENALWVGGIGKNLLLALDGESPSLCVLTGERCVVSATETPAFDISKHTGEYQFTSQGIAYYKAAENQVVYLDHQLQQISQITLPEKPEGIPVMAPDGSEIYYSLGNEVRAYDTTRNITRPVKSQLVKTQVLQQAYFNGKILSCKVEYEDGKQGVVYFDSQTGETLSTNNGVSILDTSSNRYFVVSNDGMVRQELFGNLDSSASALNIPDDTQLLPATALGGVVSVTVTEDKTQHLSLYDFSTGCVSSKVEIKNISEIISAYADARARVIWFLGKEDNTCRLFCWDPQKSQIASSESIITEIFTSENPDEEGIAACKLRAQEMNKTHGVKIQLWDDAVSETGKYSVEIEYRPAAINSMLDELEAVLQIFPEKFLSKSATKPLQLCLVKTVGGKTQSVQFYKNANSYIFLSTGCNVKEELIRTLGYVVNSRVVSNSPKLDKWSDLNPEEFVYGQPNEVYLEQSNRYFADMEAMSSIVEDRSSIFRYAMDEKNKELFASEAMQQKLKLLCEGIRSVWRWKKETAVFPWEQHLAEPIAYKQ